MHLPSTEQQRILDKVGEIINASATATATATATANATANATATATAHGIIVDAVAGSGKTTTVMLLANQFP